MDNCHHPPCSMSICAGPSLLRGAAICHSRASAMWYVGGHWPTSARSIVTICFAAHTHTHQQIQKQISKWDVLLASFQNVLEAKNPIINDHRTKGIDDNYDNCMHTTLTIMATETTTGKAFLMPRFIALLRDCHIGRTECQ